MNNILALFAFTILFTMTTPSFAQVVITDDGSPETVDASAVFELQSTSKGMLAPKMTTSQRNAITNPATGLIVFDTSYNRIFVYDGSDWVTSRRNWSVSDNRIKLLPNDFVGTLKDDKKGKTALPVYFDDKGQDDLGLGTTEKDAELVAFVTIPAGFKATTVTIYGSNSSANYYIYEGNITSGDDLTDALGSAPVGLSIDFADVEATNSNYLIVSVKFPKKNKNQLWGGYLTIEPI